MAYSKNLKNPRQKVRVVRYVQKVKLGQKELLILIRQRMLI